MTSDGLSEQQYLQGKTKLLNHLKKWDKLGTEYEKNNIQISQQEFKAWFDDIKNEGWTRRDVYQLIWDIFKNHDEELTECSLDQLGEFENGLTGFCHENCIERFPGDPIDRMELASYVRGGAWR